MSKECGFDSHRGHKSDMPRSEVKICLRVHLYLTLQYPIIIYFQSVTHGAVRAKATPEKAEP